MTTATQRPGIALALGLRARVAAAMLLQTRSRRSIVGFSFSLLSQRSNRSPRRRPQRSAGAKRFRPQLEPLEDRLVPSTGTTVLKVTSLADSGKGTLRSAILLADKLRGRNCEIDITVPGTIVLESPLPAVSNNITIDGLGASQTLIERDPKAAPFRLLTVDPGVTAGLSALAAAQGNAGAGNGGAVDNFGALTVTNCNLYSNSATNGGAIQNEAGANLNANGTSFSGNTAAFNAGAIFNGGTAAVAATAFTSNSAPFGGAINSFPGADLTINAGTSFTSNSASNSGGAIDSSGMLTAPSLLEKNVPGWPIRGLNGASGSSAG